MNKKDIAGTIKNIAFNHLKLNFEPVIACDLLITLAEDLEKEWNEEHMLSEEEIQEMEKSAKKFIEEHGDK